MADKWIEVDIYLRDYSRTNEVLCMFVRPFVERCKAEHSIRSWHFFREPQIRLRFFGEEETIGSTRNELDLQLRRLEIEQNTLYDRHVFGRHGEEGKEYVGEADFWGNDWPIAVESYNLGAEKALQLLCNNQLSKPLAIHGERYVHLLLNQLGLGHAYVRTPDRKVVLQYVRDMLVSEK